MIGPRSRCAALLLAAAGASAHAADANWGWKATALVGAPVGAGEAQSARMSFEPSLKWQHETVEVRGGIRLRWLDQQRERRTDVDVRELSAAWRGADTTLTLGAQQLNWGRMDILRVTDIVNPVDQKDLFYEELPEAKLALWMANWEWHSGARSVQLIATPQVPVDRLPARVAGLPVHVARPSNSLGNSTLAVRYAFDAAGWNADLVAIRGWQSMPSLRPFADGAGLRLEGAPARQNSVGFSADKPLGSTVLRLEGLYARTRHEEAAGVRPASQRALTFGSGLDIRTGPWFVAGQVIATRNFDPDSASGESKNQAFVSAIVQRKWLQDRLSGRALHIRETAHGSAWTSLQASYELSPNQLLRVQGDWFTGKNEAAFGVFRGRSRIAASVRLQF